MKKERYNPEDYKKPKREVYVYDTESNNGGVKRVCKKYKIGFYKNPYGSSAYFDDVHNIDRFCKCADKNGWDDKVAKMLKDTAMELKHASYTESKEIVNRLNKRLITMFPTKAEKEALKEAIRIAKARATLEKQRKELADIEGAEMKGENDVMA